MEVAGIEYSELKTEVVAGQNDKSLLKSGYTQIPPQEIVSSCPELAIVILNWEYLSIGNDVNYLRLTPFWLQLDQRIIFFHEKQRKTKNSQETFWK